MEKNIKDYLHLYYGYMMARFDGIGERFRDVRNDAFLIKSFEGDGKRFYTYKFLLRPLSDMTEEEKKHLLVNCMNEPYMYASGTFSISKSGYIGVSQESGYVNFCANVTAFHYLLSKGFDLFNLISEGLAIDKTKQL